jgi:hypothetical protein
VLWTVKNFLGFGRWITDEVLFSVRTRLARNGSKGEPYSLASHGFEKYVLSPDEPALAEASTAALEIIRNADAFKNRPGFMVLEDGEGSVRVFISPGTDAALERRFDPLYQLLDPSPLARHLGHQLRPGYLMVQRTVPFQSTGRFGRSGYHVDYHWRSGKSYVYLTDVGARHGPLVLVPGTMHLDFPLFRKVVTLHWKSRKRVYQDLDFYYYYIPADSPRSSELDLRALPLTGPKGTVINFDDRTYHKAGVLTEGERLVFAVYWYWKSWK